MRTIKSGQNNFFRFLEKSMFQATEKTKKNNEASISQDVEED